MHWSQQTTFSNRTRLTLHMDITKWSLKSIDYILCSWRWRSSIQSSKTRPGADYGSEVKCVCVCLDVQSCATLCDPMNCSPPGTHIHGILQAGILGRVDVSLSRDLPNPGIEPGSPALQVDSLPSEPPGKHICQLCMHAKLLNLCLQGLSNVMDLTRPKYL